MADEAERGRRRWAWLSALAAGITTTIYLIATATEGEAFWDIAPWAMLMLLGTGMALCAALVPNRPVRVFSAVTAAVVFGILGLIAIFTVGFGFLVAAAFAIAAAAEGGRRARPRESRT